LEVLLATRITAAPEILRLAAAFDVTLLDRLRLTGVRRKLVDAGKSGCYPSIWCGKPQRERSSEKSFFTEVSTLEKRGLAMQILKGDLSDIKGIPPSGLCVGVHRAGAIHQKMVAKYGDRLAVWSLRPDLDFIAFKKEGLGEQGIRSTSDMESIEATEKLIYGVRGAPPEVREKAREKGLTLLADATCPFVTQQEEAEIELLNAGCHLVVLSSRTHHGIPRLQGIARDKGKEVFIVEREEDIDAIRVTRFEPIGVIVQTTFWLETYKKIMARILERFANVQIRNTACIDSLQRLPEVEKLAKEVDAIIIFGWTEGMTTRMLEVAHAFNEHVHKIEKVDDLQLDWLRGKEKVGIIGANETPEWMIHEAIERIKSMAA
jgi:4-hydroxy-3-methylbut-2-enyl diphosphate reductase